MNRFRIALLLLPFCCAATAQTAPSAPEPDAQARSVERYGAVGNGTSDDAPAIMAAVKSLGSKGGIVSLACSKNYAIKTNLAIGAPGVTLRGCLKRPYDPGGRFGRRDPRFPGSINDLGRLIRDPAATIFVGRDSGLEDLIVQQAGVTVPQADTDNFAGTAVSSFPGGAGVGARLDNVMILGGARCFDGSNGGSGVQMHHVYGDCAAVAFDFGQSAGYSSLDDVSAAPFATQGFPGYPIKEIEGDGMTTIVTFDSPATFPVGDRVTLLGTLSDDGRKLFPNVAGYRIIASSAGSVRFSSPLNTSRAAPGKAKLGQLGNLTEYSRQLLRPGTGFHFHAGCDDTHLGVVGDFGHRIGFDFQCNGIFNVDHIWTDNNADIGVRIGTRTKPVAHAHINSIFAAETGTGIGLQINAPDGPAKTDVMIDKISVIGTSTDCIQVNGAGASLQFGMAHVRGCARYGLDVTDHASVFGESLNAIASTIGGRVLVPGSPAENVQIAMISTDGKPGMSLYGTAVRMPSAVKAVGSSLLLPVTSVNHQGTEIYLVNGTGTYSTIAACWGGRSIRLIFESTGRLIGTGNIALPEKSFGGEPGKMIDLTCDPVASKWRKAS